MEISIKELGIDYLEMRLIKIKLNWAIRFMPTVEVDINVLSQTLDSFRLPGIRTHATYI